ncbi:hypothetical protein ACTQ5J_08435 [Fundicoccus sp. Sow4_F4]|uniref:hypothetical protein n=1 Tax=Fundicoccus sp. Sow4_F4 TaxID=3438783 RepID=UPI003F938F60
MRNRYENLNLILRGILSISLAIALFIFREQVIIFFTQVIIAFLFINGGAKFMQVVMWQRSNKQLSQIIMQLLVACAHLMIASWLLLEQDFTTVFLVKAIGYYQLLMAVINVMSYLLMVNDGVKHHFDILIRATIHLFFGLSSLVLPTAVDSTLIRVGWYFILLGVASIIDGRDAAKQAVRSVSHKRRWRIGAPVIFTVLLPDTLIREFNQYFTVEGVSPNTSVAIVEANRKTYNQYNAEDLEVFIHVGKTGFDRVGHVDISYKNQVYSYGNHDIESRKVFDLIGDGVLFVADKFKYIEFCMSEGSTVFVYAIRLSSQQKIALEAELENLMADTQSWELTEESQRQDYVGKMQKATEATLFKFSRGKFKTYFVLGTNCVLLADQLIGTSGVDILALNGVLTPGAYLEYFERESQKEWSFISAKFIINEGIFRDKQQKIKKEEA